MNKKERVRAALAGQPVDHPPIGFWGHDFLREWSARDLADYHVERYRTYDDDFIKLNPRATSFYEDWGNRYDRPDRQRQPAMLAHAVHSAEELAALPEIDPTVGAFGEQREALRLLLAEVGGEVDVVQTVFSPISVAGRLMGPDLESFRSAARTDPAAVHTGLQTITRVLIRYSRACLDAGAAGIFFATTDWGTSDNADEDLYREFGRPYDLQTLYAVRDAPFNILHVCRANNFLRLMYDYPVPVINWDTHGAGNDSLAEALPRTRAAVMGGIDRQALLNADPETVAEQAREAVRSTGGRRVLLGPSCSDSPDAPPANLRAAVAAARGG
ncbi:MAG: uroporphyrinogen decarboxylase family protein [Dehalococcoidia bacterium]